MDEMKSDWPAHTNIERPRDHERGWNRRLKVTADGSSTWEVVEWGVCYHSLHGALTESTHVFLHQGLMAFWELNRHRSSVGLRILEVGLGTGLNAALTWEWCQKHGVKVEYVGLEPFPLSEEEWRTWEKASGASGTSGEVNGISWPDEPWSESLKTCMRRIQGHAKDPVAEELFSLQIIPSTLESWLELGCTGEFDLCYYDAFAPQQQPELWTEEIFHSLRRVVREGGMLVTYCSKGEVRRNMEKAGWLASRLPGPPGKREMLRLIHEPVTRLNFRVYGLILNATRSHVIIAKERFPDGSVGQKFPGGGIDRGEGILEALWRECKEELGTSDRLVHLGHAFTTDFFVRSAFRSHEQIISIYHWLQSETNEHAWWDEKPEGLTQEGALIEMNWVDVTDVVSEVFRFPIDRHVAEQFATWLNDLNQSSPIAG